MIKSLKWDSDFFNRKIAEIELSGSLTDTNFIDEYRGAFSPDLIQCCCSVKDVSSIRLLEDYGFRFVDLRIEYIRNVETNVDGSTTLFKASESDLADLIEISRTVFTESRYFYSGLPEFRVRQMFEIWVQKSLKGEFDDICLKISSIDRAIAFVTLKFLYDRSASIGLLGVNDDYRNKGVATQMIQSLYAFLNSKGITNVKVATQGRNIGANNFYIKNGFYIADMKCWYLFNNTNA